MVFICWGILISSAMQGIGSCKMRFIFVSLGHLSIFHCFYSVVDDLSKRGFGESEVSARLLHLSSLLSNQ